MVAVLLEIPVSPVGATAERPGHFSHFLCHGRGDGRVTDIGVDLHQEIAADNHRLSLGMIDVGGNDRSSASPRIRRACLGLPAQAPNADHFSLR